MATPVPEVDEYGWRTLPCPECRQFAERPIYNRDSLYSGNMSIHSWVYLHCPVCDYNSAPGKDAKEAVDAWNEAYKSAVAKDVENG